MIRPAGRQIRNARNGVIDNGTIPHRGAEHLIAAADKRIDERLETRAREEQPWPLD